MLFWFFTLAMALLIPLTMVGGSFLLANPPEYVGPFAHLFGYRTPMSKKNADTWVFAHVHCSRVWRRVGLALLPLSLFAMLPCIGGGAGAVGWWGLWVVMAQIAVLLAAVAPTELALRRVFDRNGNRRA